MTQKQQHRQFVESFRHSAPYIHAHTGRTIVLVFGGEAVADAQFCNLVH
ncbi:MAG: amino-acid N-acetyltransferase, partial [Gammaproteobacteria bacterium]